MRLLQSAISAALLFVSAAALTEAVAADLDGVSRDMAGEPAASFDWTGFYAGANLGAGRGDADWTIAGAPASFSSARMDGAVLGGQIGYDWQLTPRWVIGVEGSLSWTGVRGHDVEFPLTDFTDHTSLLSTGDISACLGVTVRDRTLLFAKTGVAWGTFDHATTNSIIALASEKSEAGTRFGWLIGAGVETAIAANWTISVEYDWISAGKHGFDLVNGLDDASPAIDDHGFSIVKAGLNYKFGPNRVPLKD